METKIDTAEVIQALELCKEQGAFKWVARDALLVIEELIKEVQITRVNTAREIREKLKEHFRPYAEYGRREIEETIDRITNEVIKGGD